MEYSFDHKIKCAICGEVANNPMGVLDFLHTCKKHAAYSQHVQPEVIKKQLGLISDFTAEYKKCQICDSNLTIAEVNDINANDGIRTCTAHKFARQWWQIDLAQMWFKFVYYNGPATWQTDYKKFRDFLKTLN